MLLMRYIEAKEECFMRRVSFQENCEGPANAIHYGGDGLCGEMLAKT